MLPVHFVLNGDSGWASSWGSTLKLWATRHTCHSIWRWEGSCDACWADSYFINTYEKQPPKSQLVTAEFPLPLSSVHGCITCMGLCWKPCSQKQGQTLLSSGGEDGDLPQVCKTWEQMGHVAQENNLFSQVFFRGDLRGYSPLCCPLSCLLCRAGHRTSYWFTWN